MSLWRIIFLIVLVVVSTILRLLWIMPSYNVFLQRYREVRGLPPQPPENPWIGGFHWGWVMERQTDTSLSQVQRVVRFRFTLLMLLIAGAAVVWLSGPQ